MAINRTTKLLPLVAGLALAICVVFLLLVRTPARVPGLPNPNGYDRVVAAGQKVRDTQRANELDRPALATQVASNAPALQEARESFRLESRVPLVAQATPGMPSSWGEKYTDHIPAIKRLSLAFSAEFELARLEQRHADALRSCLDLLEVARVAGRGGSMLDALVALSTEALAVQHAEYVLPTLSESEAARLAARLEDFDLQRDTFAQTMEYEHRWVRIAHGMQGVVVRLITLPATKKAEQAFHGKLRAMQHRTRGLMLKAAARAFELEHHATPQTLGDLVPAYLKAVPEDPFTGRPFPRLD
jgi:hypothetical protein